LTIVRIAHAKPRPGSMPDGSVVVGEHLIVLADTVPAGDGGYRVVPLRVRVPGGQELSYLLERPAEDTAMVGVLQETVVRMLHAAGVRVTAVDIEPTGEDVTELRAETVTTRVGLSTAADPPGCRRGCRIRPGPGGRGRGAGPGGRRDDGPVRGPG
jgi:hypothetical protein